MNSRNVITAVGILMLFFSSFLWNEGKVHSQNNMGIGTMTPDPSALLHVENLLQNKGLLVPRMGTAARDAIGTPANGLLIYNTDCNVFNYYQLDHWESINGLTIGGGTIIGNPNPCQVQVGVGYKIPTVPGNTTYFWTVPPGASITGGQGTDSITVDFGSSDGFVCVTASNTCGDADSLCLAINLATAALSPTALPASAFTCTTFNANWAPVINTAAYILDVSDDPTFPAGGMLPGYDSLEVIGTSTTQLVSGLMQDSVYYYRVRVRNGCGVSSFSNIITASTTAPIAPTATAASNFTCTSFSANWGASAGATYYLLDVSTDSGFSTFFNNGTDNFNEFNAVNNTTYNVTGLTINTTYYYRVRAANACDTSAYSNTITIGTTETVAPTATAASNYTCSSFQANWGAVGGASAYYVDVSTSSSFADTLPGFSNYLVGGQTFLNVSPVAVNSIYYYRVRAYNGCTLSQNSNTIIVSTSPPLAPTATPASNFTCVSVNANWGAVQGAVQYYLDVSTSTSFTDYVAGFQDSLVGNVTTYNISGLTPNTTYYFRVRSYNGCSLSPNSNTISFGTTPPVAPTATSPDNFTCISVNVNWGAVFGAIQYFVDISTNSSFTTFVAPYNNAPVVGGGTTLNITGLTANTTYFFRVRADNGCSTSSNSNTITFGTTAPIAPTATLADNYTCTSVNANWGSVSGAIQYYLDVSTSSSFTDFIPGFNNTPVANVTTYNVTGLVANTTYYYRVRADNGCSISSNSNTVTFGTTAPISPTATPADNFTCTSFNANWGSVPGGTQYFLDVSTNNQFSTFVNGFNDSLVGNVTTFNITNLIANTTYYYRVRAGNGCSVSLSSNTVSVGTTAPISPTATPASNFTCTSLNANWGAVPGATNYILDVATSASFGADTLPGYSNLSVGAATTYLVTGLTPNVTYHYRVRADNGCSISSYSNTISIGTTAPISPTATSASNFTCTSFNANWGAVSGATTYYVDIATSASFGTSIVTAFNNFATGNVTTYNFTGLTANVVYYYRVRADNGCSISTNSNTIVVGTATPISPTATPADNFTCTSFNANWGAVPGAIQYFIDVATSASFGASTLSSYNGVNAGPVTTLNITGLSANVVYYYRVRADNGCSLSLYSNTISAGTTAPISPTATSATNLTCVSFNANWGAVSGAINYFIDVSTDVSFTTPSNFVLNNQPTASVTTYNVSGLTPGTTYYYRVRADNGCLVSLNSNTITVGTTAPVPPTATPADNFSCTSFNANWGAVTGATSYSLDVSTDVNFAVPANFVVNDQTSGSATTYNVTGLTANTTYYYRVRATNGCLTSGNSNTITVSTSAPVPPTATPADNFTCTSFNANWGAVTGVIDYLLDVSTDVSFTTPSNFVLNNQSTGGATTFNVTGLVANTTYFYRIRSSNGCSISLNSNTITVGTTAPVAPTATDANNFTCTSFNANWGAVTGATSYVIEVSTDASFATYQGTYNNLNVGNVTTLNITGLTIGTTYFYRVKASNGCSTSLVSNTITVGTTAPVAPTATDANNFTCTSFNANWGAVTGATSYVIEVSTDASFATYQGTYNNLNVGNVTTLNIAGLTTGTTYFYRVKASNGCSTSLVSNTITVGTTAPVAPTATDANNFTCNSFNANWGAVTGATSYIVEVSTSASFTSFQGSYNSTNNVGNVTTLNITGLTTGVTYFYRVRASNGCAVSLNSNTITVGTTAPVAPTATDANNFTCNTFNANWGAVTGATSYIVEVSTDASFATFQGSYNSTNNVGNVTTLNITGLTTGVTYFYRVRASNGCAVSLNSNTITVSTTAPVAPTATDANNFTCTSFNANWGAVTGATSYIVEVSTNASFTTFQGTYNSTNNVGNVTTLNITGLTTGVTYFYRVRASNGCAVSLNSNTITVGTTAPVAPTATDANNFTCTSFNANWGAVTGATSYIVEVSTSASFTSFQGSYNSSNNVGNVTTLNITGLTTGVTYFYRIRASNGCSVSLNSNTITVTTTSPVAPTATDANNFTCNSFNANWGAVTGATQYYLDVSTASSFAAGTLLTGYNNQLVGNVTTYNVVGLQTGIVYYYRIRASNGCSTSLNSNTITLSTTAPVSPTATPATNFSCTSFNANWGAVSGATQYIIDVSTSANFATFITANSTTYNGLNVGNVTTLNIPGLTSNTTYYYRVKATNGCSTSLPSNTVSVGTTAPIAPVAVAASNFTCTSFNANWASVTGATQYFLDVATDANFTTILTGYNDVNVGNVTTYFVSGLTVNTTYYYRVRADNGCTFSANSNTIDVTTTSPIAPIALNADNFSCTTFNANWSASVGATSYELDVSTTGAFTAGTFVLNAFNVGSATTYNVIGLAQNMTYYYRIRAVNGCATSGNSNIIVVTISAPVAPNGIDASNITCTSLNANWGVSSGATGYYLDVSTTANFAPGTFVTPYNNSFVGNTNTYNIIGLTQGVTYYYRVRAINGCATSVNSNTVTASTTAPSAPIALNGSNFTCTSFNANWSPVLGAVAYYLDVSTDAGFTSFVTGYQDLNVGTANTYPITGLAQNANYYYRVRAANICSTSTSSNSTTVTTSAPIAPTSSGSSNLTCTSFNANWGATVGATAYYLDVSTDANYGSFVTGNGTTYNNLLVNNVTTYNITGLTVNNTYYYRVRAGNGCSISLNSNSIMTVTAAPFAPIAVAPSNLNCTSFNANWGGSVGAIAYYLDVSTSATFASFFGTYSNLNVNNVTTYNITGLTQGVTYYYRVRAASGCTTSPNSNTESATIAAPSAPAALPATNVACISFNANWTSVSGATTYIIDVSTSGTFANFVTGFNGFNTNGNVTTYNITAPEIVQGGTYFYRVRAVNGCATSGNSNLVSITTALVNAPIALAASDIACTVFNANWTPVAGVTGYEIDVSTSASFANTFITALNVGNVLTYNVTGLTLNTTYYYRVRATSACATSTNSNTIVAATNAPPAPNATTATNVTCTSMNANWSAVSGVIGYYLDVSTDANFGSFVPGFNNKSVGNVTTYNVTGLTGITVYFRVRSATACTQSINSNLVQVNPSALAAPNAGNALNVACSTFDAQWSAVSGALSYEIDVSSSASFASFITGYNDLDVGSVTTLNVTGLSVNNIYYYRVRAKNACVTSPHSTTITVSTAAPSAPGIGTTTNITCDGFNVNWSSVQGALTYYLDISTSASFATFVSPYSNFNVGSGNTYNVSGLTGLTPPFYFRMRAASGCASGPSSAPISVNPAALNAPGQLAATGVGCSDFTANWSAVSGVLSYSLDVATNSSFAAGTILASYNDLTVVGSTSHTVTGLVQNQSYYYRVRANNACVSSLSNNVTHVATSVPVAVTAITANSITCGTFNARWNQASPLPLNYYIDVSTDQTFASCIPNYCNKLISGSPTLANNISVTGLTQNTIYYYRVRAENGCGIGPYSNIITAVTTVPSAPGNLNVSASTCNSFTASWSAVSGATYGLDVSTDPAFGTSITGYPASVSGTSRVVNGLSIGILYYFRVRSVNLCGNSSWSGSLTFKIEDPAIPSPSLGSISCPTGYSIGWPLVSSATTYKVDVSVASDFSSFLVGYQDHNTGNTNGITITGLAINPGEYYVRVRSANTCGTSGNSNTLLMVTHAPSPPNTNGVLPASIACNSFTAQWGATTNATAYLLDVSTSSTFANTLTGYDDLNVGVATSFNVPGLTPGTTYYYRVYARNSCGLISASSSTVTVNLAGPSAPTNLVATVSTNSFSVTWDASASGNATTYYMDVSTSPTFVAGTFLSGYSNNNLGNVTSTTVSGLPSGWGPYYVRIRGGNACGTSSNSATLPVP